MNQKTVTLGIGDWNRRKHLASNYTDRRHKPGTFVFTFDIWKVNKYNAAIKCAQ